VSGFDAPAPLLPDLIDRQSRWLGSKPALLCGEQSLSWREFGQRLCAVAGALQAYGIRPRDRVAVLMGNGIEMVEAMFGVLRAGACVVPLNVSISDESVDAMLRDCGARAVIATAEHAGRFGTARRDQVVLWVCVDAASVGAAGSPDALPWQDFASWSRAAAPLERPAPTDADSLCNIIYSSGTTGLPKGIVHTHRRRVDWAFALAIALRYDSRAVTLCPIGLYSNISWVSLLCTFVAGGTLVIEAGFDAGRCFERIGQQRITHTSIVPVMVQRLLESPLRASADVSSMRSIMCCGSPLAIELKQRALTELGGQFIELYGLTEGLITTLAPEDAVTRPTSVGKPVPGTDIRLVGDDDREVPAGVAGEIVGRGQITMAGYWNRPDADADCTWIDADGRRWLRTGDVGRLDEEGFLYLVDRKKDMIISGGQNIYPADIEAVLVTHPDVVEVAVIGAPSARWGETPLAIVVPRSAPAALPAGSGATSDEAGAQLRDWVNARVGKQQRIAGVRFTASLPRNPNGKILKRELRRLYPDSLP
jgi:acyl-CoA synthetase (AMP-forming)/AMP-acid ligase II